MVFKAVPKDRASQQARGYLQSLNVLKCVRIPLLDLTVFPGGEEEVRLGDKLEVHHTEKWERYSSVIQLHVTKKSRTHMNSS